MEIIIFLILGVIQGLTEFLPISSSGHLILFYKLFGLEIDTMTLSILLHIATLLSVIVYYRKTLIILIKNPFCETNLKILVTTLTTCLLVLVFKPIIDKTFNTNYLFAFFIITAFLLILSDYMSSKKELSNLTNPTSINTKTLIRPEDITNINISYFQAFIVGLSQGVACIPGISRSGTTIATAKIIGVRKDVSTYSFIISIPIIIASLILDIASGGNLNNVNIIGLILSMIVCFVIGLLSIKVMTNFVKNNKLTIFSYYLLALATFLILNNMFFHIF
jgi:undecaprenyl-diphosphatase